VNHKKTCDIPFVNTTDLDVAFVVAKSAFEIFLIRPLSTNWMDISIGLQKRGTE
jgi:hypothetical protein